MQLSHFDLTGSSYGEEESLIAKGEGPTLEILATLRCSGEQNKEEWQLAAYSLVNKSIPVWSHSYKSKERLLEKFEEFTRIQLPS